MKKLVLMCLFLASAAVALVGQRTITGKVTDDKGEALIGASILVSGTSAGAVTDLDGTFTLDVPQGGRSLEISYTGYLTRELELTTESNYEIQLGSDIVTISEVVVVGYGTQQKRDVTGSISQVKGENLANLATPAFDQQLAGRAAGAGPGASTSRASSAGDVFRCVTRASRPRSPAGSRRSAPVVVCTLAPTRSGPRSCRREASKVGADVCSSRSPGARPSIPSAQAR